MSRAQIEQHGYLKSFPNLLGAVSCLCGDERHIRGVVGRFIEDGEPWTDALEAADLVLAPAACYPVYPIVAARGEVPADGLIFDVAADCFRREPSTDIDRFQSFRMREYVRVGTQAQIQAFREDWIELVQKAVIGGTAVLVLAVGIEVAYLHHERNSPGSKWLREETGRSIRTIWCSCARSGRRRWRT